jgi:hypothetical protein
MAVPIKLRKWEETGHILRKFSSAVEKPALNWNLQGQHRRRIPRRSWRIKIKKEDEIVGERSKQ